MPRLILVYNPNSTNYRRVIHEILNRKEELFRGFDLSTEYTIKKIGFENNVKNLVKILKDGDTCLAAGGDATATITANAILESEKDVTLAVLPYGNFNDLARTLGTMSLEDIGWRVADNTFSGSISRFSSEKVRSQKGMSARVHHLYPLSISVDGHFWRYATCYVTIGMTAEAVELFDEPKFRMYMKKGHKSSWRSYLALAKWYFKNRRHKVFLPEFTINGQKTAKGASDYAAVNGRSMCRIMKGGDDFRRPNLFRSANIKTVSFPKLCKLMISAILVRTPGKETKGDLLEFKTPATVELQAEGEYQIFKDVQKIEVKKGDKCLKVITKN